MTNLKVGQTPRIQDGIISQIVKPASIVEPPKTPQESGEVIMDSLKAIAIATKALVTPKKAKAQTIPTANEIYQEEWYRLRHDSSKKTIDELKVSHQDNVKIDEKGLLIVDGYYPYSGVVTYNNYENGNHTEKLVEYEKGKPVTVVEQSRITNPETHEGVHIGKLTKYEYKDIGLIEKTEFQTYFGVHESSKGESLKTVQAEITDEI